MINEKYIIHFHDSKTIQSWKKIKRIDTSLIIHQIAPKGRKMTFAPLLIACQFKKIHVLFKPTHLPFSENSNNQKIII